MTNNYFNMPEEKYISQILILFSVFIVLLLYFLISDDGLNIYNKIVSNRILNSFVASIFFSFFILGISYYLNISLSIKRKKIATNTQINERKLRNELLHSLDQHSDYFCLIDSKMRIFWANQELININNDIIGSDAITIFFEEEILKQDTILHKVIETKESIKYSKYYKKNSLYKDEKYIELNCIPIFDIDDNIVYLFLISRDITIQTQLEGSKSRLNAIIDDSEDAIFVIDKRGVIHSWNSAAEIMFGYSADQIIGQPLTILDHCINFETLVSITKYAHDNTQSIQHIDFIPLNKANKKYFVSFTIYPLFDEIGNILGISTIVKDKTDFVMAQKALVENEQKMRNLALHIDKVREEERKQIAFAVHDELGYALSAIKMDTTWLQNKVNINDKTISSRITGMLKLIDTAIQKVKSISLDLRPSVLDHFGLAAAIEWQAGEFQRRMSIRCKVTIEPSDFNVKEEFRVPIFRIFQEAITNIIRHAKASRVDIKLIYRNEILELDIIDNGIGIPVEKINDPNSFGLLGIKEKANSIGGKAIIQNNKNNPGTHVSLRLKIKKEDIINENKQL